MFNRSLLISAITASSLLAQSAKLNIDVTKIVTPISPTLYGLMTEEINHSYDGGLYAEMIQNRVFRSEWNGEPPWDLVRHGNAVVSKSIDKATGPSSALSHSLKLSATAASPGNEAGLTNPGYWGYGVRPNTTYSGSFYARAENSDIGPITISMINNATGALIAQATVPIQAGPWKQYEYKLSTGAISPSIANHLEFTIAHTGTLWLQLVSLMQPTSTIAPTATASI